MTSVAPIVYFDTNAFSTLYRHEDEIEERRLRRQIQRSLERHAIRYVTAAWTVEELGGLADKRFGVYGDITAYLFRTVEGLFVDTSTIVDQEIATGRPLHESERYASGKDERRLRAATRHNRNAVIAAYKTYQSRVAQHAVELRSARVASLAEIATLEKERGDPRGYGMSTWCDDLSTHITEWTRDLVRKQTLVGSQSAGDAAIHSKTANNFVAYSLARWCWYLRDGRRVDDGDDTDTHHYACACYADVFVSNDIPLHGIVALLPTPAVRLVTVQQFANEYLA